VPPRRFAPPRRRLLLASALAPLADRGKGAPRDTAVGGREAAARDDPPGAERSTLRASDGAQLSVLDSGSDGVPIVLVPGWCMPATIWRAQFDALAPRRRIVALDPRGQGESDITAGGYTADRRAADIAELVARWPRVVLVGWSLAVLETLQMLDRHGAGRVAGLMLVDNSIGEPPPPPASDFLTRLRTDRRATLERFIRAMFVRPPGEDRIASLLDGALRLPLDASVQLLSYPYPREHWRAIARAVPVPLAYVVTPHLAPQAASLAAHRPGSRIEVFEQAGHALFVDQAERFNQLLETFAAAVS